MIRIINGITDIDRGGDGFIAKLCPTLCDPRDCSMQASLSITNSQSLPKPMSIKLVMPSNHFILCHPLLLLPSIFPSIRVFSNESYGGGGGLVAKSCPTLVAPWTVARQAPLSMGFSRKEYWSGLPLPSPRDLPDPGIEPKSPALADGFFTTEPLGKPPFSLNLNNILLHVCSILLIQSSLMDSWVASTFLLL